MKSTRPAKRLRATSIAWATVAAIIAVCAGGVRAADEAWHANVGYDKLTAILGTSTPVAAGVTMSQVEAPDGAGAYFPVTGSPEFSTMGDPLNQAITFIDGSGVSMAASSHSNDVAHYIFGNMTGLSKAANTVTIYNANNWLQDQLHYNSTQTPESQSFKVQNHSWVGSFNSNPNDLSTLRRLDYVIERDDVTEVVGANNNTDSDQNPNNGSDGLPSTTLAHPNLLAHSYNALVVGRTDARHSRGATGAIYGPGRFRPDIVAPATSASRATAEVSGAAGMLRGAVAGTNADRSETMKAILMAGATKTEFANFVEPATSTPNPWDHTPTRPLDDIFGAGQLNVYNSYLMTAGGQTAGSTTQPATTAKSYGWDYKDFKSNSSVGDVFYNFDVPVGSTAQEFSVILAWNVKINDTNPSGSVFAPQESLQNLDLTLYDSSASFLGSMLDQSVSTVDNVEHIYKTNLGPGTYTLKVSGAASWDYGLAWRMSTLFDQTNADFDGDGNVDGADFLAWQKNSGLLVGAVHAQGDADGDGDVDRDDLVIFNVSLALAKANGTGSGTGSSGGAVNANGSGSSGAIPEPATWALVMAALGAGAAATRRARPRRRMG